MSLPDELEFWLDDRVIATIDSAMQPVVGDKVSIRGKTYRARSRNYALDHADERAVRHMRLAVNLEPLP